MIHYSVQSRHTDSARWYPIAYQIWNIHAGKRISFENGMHQMLLKQLKLYSVMSFSWYHARCHQMSRLHWFFMGVLFATWTNPLVWYSCQGKQSDSSEGVKTANWMLFLSGSDTDKQRGKKNGLTWIFIFNIQPTLLLMYSLLSVSSYVTKHIRNTVQTK